MDQRHILSEISPAHADIDRLLAPAEFSLRLTGPAVLVLALTLAAILRGRGRRAARACRR